MYLPNFNKQLKWIFYFVWVLYDTLILMKKKKKMPDLLMVPIINYHFYQQNSMRLNQVYWLVDIFSWNFKKFWRNHY